MADKTIFINQIQDVSTQLAQATAQAENLINVFFDRGYNIGGSNAITDANIVDAFGTTELDAALISSFITLAQQLANFANNAAVTTGDYSATLNRLRTDV